MLWSIALGVQQVRVGPGDVIDVIACPDLKQIDANGNITWTTSLGAQAFTCTNAISPFTHQLDVAPSGDVVVATNSLAAWSSTGAPQWVASVGSPDAPIGVATTSDGVIWVAGGNPANDEETLLFPFASDGTALTNPIA